MGYLYLFTQWAGTTKVKPIWILLKQETVGGSGISWAVCKSAPRSNHASTTPLSFIQARCPSCHPANSGKALKAAIDRSLRPARPAAVNLRVCCCGPVLGQTDRRTDTVPLRRPCCTYYAGSANKTLIIMAGNSNLKVRCHSNAYSEWPAAKNCIACLIAQLLIQYGDW